MVHRAEVAAAALQREGISAEIIDLRSLVPYDWEAIAATVRKTHRVIVAYEDMLSFGYGAEIAARIAEELFDELDAPIKRVAATDTFCGYQPKLEDAILPQTEDISECGQEDPRALDGRLRPAASGLAASRQATFCVPFPYLQLESQDIALWRCAMVCQHCQKEIAEGSKFCYNCGAQQAGVAGSRTHGRSVAEALDALQNRQENWWRLRRAGRIF